MKEDLSGEDGGELFTREEHWKQLWKDFNTWFDNLDVHPINKSNALSEENQKKKIKALIKTQFKLKTSLINKLDELETQWFMRNEHSINILKAVRIQDRSHREWNDQKKMIENIVNFALDNKDGVTISLNKFFDMAINYGNS